MQHLLTQEFVSSCRLLSVEEADAPSTPTAEAKRPSRSAPAEAPAAEPSLSQEAQPQLAQQAASTSANGPIPQHSDGDNTLQEPQCSSSNGSHHEAVMACDEGAQLSQQSPPHSSPAESPELALADQVGSSSRPGDEEQQATNAPEAAQPHAEVQESAILELQRQRSLEIEAHLAQVRLTRSCMPCKPSQT